MQKIRLHLVTFFCLVFAISTLNGCDDDFWEDDDYYPIPNNSYVEGEWIITGTEGKHCSYNPEERWLFYRNGDFETLGFDNLNEYGRWIQDSHSRINIRFDRQPRRLKLHIEELNRHYMTVYVIDELREPGYSNTIEYRLFLDKVAGPRLYSLTKQINAAKQDASTTKK